MTTGISPLEIRPPASPDRGMIADQDADKVADKVADRAAGRVAGRRPFSTTLPLLSTVCCKFAK